MLEDILTAALGGLLTLAGLHAIKWYAKKQKARSSDMKRFVRRARRKERPLDLTRLPLKSIAVTVYLNSKPCEGVWVRIPGYIGRTIGFTNRYGEMLKTEHIGRSFSVEIKLPGADTDWAHKRHFHMRTPCRIKYDLIDEKAS